MGGNEQILPKAQPRHCHGRDRNAKCACHHMAQWPPAEWWNLCPLHDLFYFSLLQYIDHFSFSRDNAKILPENNRKCIFRIASVFFTLAPVVSHLAALAKKDLIRCRNTSNLLAKEWSRSGWCSTPPCCSFARHLVGKMVFRFSFAH